MHGGTFHAWGTALLRRFGGAGRTALRLHDHGPGGRRGSDAALARQPGATRPEVEAIPQEGDAAPRLFAPRQHRAGRSRRSSIRTSRSFVDYVDDITRIFADYTSPQGERNLVDYDDLLLFWALLLEQSPDARRPHRRPVRPHPGGRVPGHEPAAGAHPARHVPRPPEPHRRGRRRAEHLLVPRRELPQHPRLPAPVPGHTARHARAELPLHAADPRRHQHAHLARRGAVHEESLDGARRRREALARDGAGRAAADALRGRPHARAARGGHAAARDRRALPRRLHERRSRDRAHQPQDPVREVGRAQVPRGGAREGRARLSARARESARRGELVPHLHAACPASATSRRGRSIETMAERSWDPDAFDALRAAAAGPRRAPVARRSCCACCAARGDDGIGARRQIAPSAQLYDDILRERYDRPEPRLADLDQLRTIAGGLSEPGGVPRGAGARAAVEHAGPGHGLGGSGRRRAGAQHRALAPRARSGTPCS